MSLSTAETYRLWRMPGRQLQTRRLRCGHTACSWKFFELGFPLAPAIVLIFATASALSLLLIRLLAAP